MPSAASLKLARLLLFVAKGSGTEIAADKSLADALGTDGSGPISHYYDHASILQYMHGQHRGIIILFVIPEAVGAINDHNAAIRTTLEKLGEVITITQGDALEFPDFGSVILCVLGTDNPTAWVTANLADIKSIPDLPLICCDARSAAYMAIGVDGLEAGGVTDINARANIKGTILGAGFHETPGLAVGANVIAAAGTSFSTLDMSDADLTELWLAYESVANNTDVVLGMVRRIQPDGTVGIDVDAAEVPATMAFYGPAYSFNALNTLGQDLLYLLGSVLIYSATIGSILTIAGDIGAVETKLFGNLRTRFSVTVPLAAFIAGNTGGLGTEMPNNTSFFDLIAGAGIPSFPVAAVPGDGENYAAVLRQVYDDLATVDGLIDDIVNDIGVFPTASYATLAAYVEDVRTRLIAIVADTGAIVWGDITGIVNDIGVFPTASYATLAAYVEDIRTRLINILTESESHPTLAEIQAGDMATILADIAEGKLRSFRRTYRFATTVEGVTDAAEVSLAAPAVVTVTFPTGATLLEAKVVASIKVNSQAEFLHNIGLTLQKNVAVGGWIDIIDMTATPNLTLAGVDRVSDALTIVESLAITTGQTVQFRWQVDSDNAGHVHYTQVFVLSVEYDFQ